MDREDYHVLVSALESGLAVYAKKSFESFSPSLINGDEALKIYQDIWASTTGRAKLSNRTPLQLERDRILYSDILRKQTEKYHVLYNGQRRITRNYTTHTMRMAHVARSICRGLKLNSDFAEAMALGCKAGAVPFIHAAKDVVHDWIIQRLYDVDKNYRETISRQSEHLKLDGTKGIADYTAGNIKKSLPWIVLTTEKTGPKTAPVTYIRTTSKAYSSGQESYWLLSTNPFIREDNKRNFYPETMYGIWRHSITDIPQKESFNYEWAIEGSPKKHIISWEHCTYESIVVQYSDDITWVIENLNDANNAALLNKSKGLYLELLKELDDKGDIPSEFSTALRRNDAGGLYTFFITDFISNSVDKFKSLKEGADERIALRECRKEALIGLSENALYLLNNITQFLEKHAFDETRVKNRKKMLQTIVETCLSLLFDSPNAIKSFIEDRSILECWGEDKEEKAKSLVDEKINRIQLAVDILAYMGDQEIYDFVGMHSL